jgi:hypothetical protein
VEGTSEVLERIGRQLRQSVLSPFPPQGTHLGRLEYLRSQAESTCERILGEVSPELSSPYFDIAEACDPLVAQPQWLV